MSFSEKDMAPHPIESAMRVPELTYLSRPWDGENVLHVYPRTFNEKRPAGEDDIGIGTILGITEKLDWMGQSGVTAIWLGPIYASPGLDGNYDISDYYKVNADLGSLSDVRQLIAEAHRREIRVIFDLVPNHTSDQSEWFKASSDPSHPEHEKYRDYYYWQDPRAGRLPKSIVGDDRLAGLPDGLTVPNNWSSIFSLPQIDEVKRRGGGEIPPGTDIPAVTAWVWNGARQQFYLAEFMKQQPSLNWHNPAVREEIKRVVRFWLNEGVDSFRVDVINHIGKDPGLRDELPAPVGPAIGQYNPGTTNPHDQWKQENLVSHWPQLGQYAGDLLSVLDETAYENRNIRFILEDWMSALGNDDRLDRLRPDKANVFNFEMLLNTNREHWSAENIGRIITGYYSRMRALKGAVPNQVTGNHDSDTLRTRLGSPAAARAAHLLLATLPGVLYTWQGDMLGRPNMIVPEDRQQDGNIGKRDGERVPMQWDASLNGGFSKARPEDLWLPSVDPAVYRGDNMELQMRDPRSPYRLVREILRRRQADPALQSGSLRLLHTDHAGVLALARSDPKDARRQVIALTNFTQDTVPVAVRDAWQGRGTVTLSSIDGREPGDRCLDLGKTVLLRPDESYLLDSY